MRQILYIAWILAAVSGTPESPRAEPGPIGQWLMDEPLTLWDRGMIQANEAGERSAKSAAKDHSSTIVGGARYDYDANEISLYAIVLGAGGDISHQQCNEVRKKFIADIAILVPNAGASKLREILIDTISSWFSHEGFKRGTRDEKLGEKMAKIIFVAIYLAGEAGTISCRDRILTFEAPSMPSERTGPMMTRE